MWSSHHWNTFRTCQRVWNMVNKVWIKKTRHIQNFDFNKKSTFFALFSWNLLKIITSCDIIFTKCHEDWKKNMDFLLMANIWTWTLFFDPVLKSAKIYSVLLFVMKYLFPVYFNLLIGVYFCLPNGSFTARDKDINIPSKSKCLSGNYWSQRTWHKRITGLWPDFPVFQTTPSNFGTKCIKSSQFFCLSVCMSREYTGIEKYS